MNFVFYCRIKGNFHNRKRGDKVSNKKFIARFGEVILRNGIASIPNAIFSFQKDLGLKVGETWFIAQILRFKWSTELPRPSLRKMAEYTGVSARTLHNYKNSLIDKGYLEIINRRDSSGRKDTNYYDFTGLFSRIIKLIDKEDYLENPLEEPIHSRKSKKPEKPKKSIENTDDELSFEKTKVTLTEPEESTESEEVERPMNKYTKEDKKADNKIKDDPKGVYENIAHRGYVQKQHIGMGKNNTYLCEKITPHKKNNNKKKNIKKNNSTKIYSTYKDTNKQKETKQQVLYNSQTSSEVVVNLNKTFKEATGLDKLSLFNLLVKKYGVGRVEEVVLYLKNIMPKGKIKNPVGFIIKALDENWEIDEYDYQKILNKKQEERIKMLRKELKRNMDQRADPEVARKYLKEIKKSLLEVKK